MGSYRGLYSSMPGSLTVTCKEVFFTAQCDSTQAIFGPVVVDFQLAIGGVGPQRIPFVGLSKDCV